MSYYCDLDQAKENGANSVVPISNLIKPDKLKMFACLLIFILKKTTLLV